jgi:hypothetical protein
MSISDSNIKLEPQISTAAREAEELLEKEILNPEQVNRTLLNRLSEFLRLRMSTTEPIESLLTSAIEVYRFHLDSIMNSPATYVHEFKTNASFHVRIMNNLSNRIVGKNIIMVRFPDEDTLKQKSMVELDILNELDAQFQSGLIDEVSYKIKLGIIFCAVNWAFLISSGLIAAASGASLMLSLSQIEELPLISGLASGYLGYELIPGLGGLQALLSTGYSAISYSTPATIKHITKRLQDRGHVPFLKSVNDLAGIWLRSVLNLSELGFITMPFLTTEAVSIKNVNLLRKAMARYNEVIVSARKLQVQRVELES